MTDSVTNPNAKKTGSCEKITQRSRFPKNDQKRSFPVVSHSRRRLPKSPMRKGPEPDMCRFEPARETHFSRNGYRAIRDARIDGVLTGNQERMVQRKILSARCPTSVT